MPCHATEHTTCEQDRMYFLLLLLFVQSVLDIDGEILFHCQ